MIGQTIGHYRIVSKLGAGGMGEVYLADDTKLGRQVALKFLPPQVAGTPEVLARFKHEAKAAAALDHPNIITVHETGEHDGRAYIVMSYVAGEKLSDAIERKDMTLDRALQLTLQICEGLNKAHQAGIVHRDIKPDNIAIDTDGSVKILDFGLAKLDNVTRLTQEDSTVGTLYYMSPEQARGEDVDARTDLFSVGALMYEMITGKRAFDGEHAAAVHYSIANEDPQPMSRFNNQVSPALENIVNKLLAKDANARYQTAADLIADIRVQRSGSVTPAAPTTSRRPVIWAAAAALVVALGLLVIFKPFGTGAPPTAEARPMVAVLPFENLGVSADEYFADGITEEITSRLATITGLGVISRTSAMQYKNATQSIAEIADELGVQYILEGTIRWDKSQDPERVRITPQLIRVSDDTHLWANNYERELNRIFEVQADIAEQIATAMEVTLLDKDRRTIESVPTENSEAYTYFLRGRKAVVEGTGLNTGLLEAPIEWFTRAVELDPEFAVAWAWLSIVHSGYFHNGIDRTGERLELARHAADRAFLLDPGSADANMAMTFYHYWGLKDYNTALTWAGKAAGLRSGDAEIIQIFGWILRRMGRFEDSIDRLQESLTLAPRDRSAMVGISECYLALRRFDEAGEYIRRAIALDPTDPFAYWHLSLVEILEGDLEGGRRALESYPGEPGGRMLYLWSGNYYVTREFDKAIAALDSASPVMIVEELFYPRTLLTGLAHAANGDQAAARADLETASNTLEALIEERPDDHRLYSSLGLAQAGLGEGDAAVANGRRSVELYPMSKDRFGAPWRLMEMAKIYGLAGYVDEALDQIDELLSIDCYATTHWVRQRPEFDSIRSDPRFEELLREYDPST